MPNIETTDHNDLGIQSNLPKASSVTNSEPRHKLTGMLSNTEAKVGRSSISQAEV